MTNIKKQNNMENSDKANSAQLAYHSVKISEILTVKGIETVLKVLKEDSESGSINYGVMYKRVGGQVLIKLYTGGTQGPMWEEGWSGINVQEMREDQEDLDTESMTEEEYKRYQEYEASTLADIIFDGLTSFDRHYFFTGKKDIEDSILSLIKQWTGKGIGISYKIWPTHVDFWWEIIGKEIGYDGTEGWQTRIYNNKTAEEVSKIVLAEIREKIKK